jgi:hypothetical protein
MSRNKTIKVKMKEQDSNLSVPSILQKRTLTIFLIALLLVAVTMFAYIGVLENGFVNFDDGVYVTKNDTVKQGLTWSGVIWACTTFFGSNWHPLTWLSHMLDIQFFALNPSGHHFTNLLLHVIATIFLFGFLVYTTRHIWLSAFVASLFALHPLHVESVAWVAERKDVLSAVFFFATIWAYAYYVRSPSVKRYAPVFVLFIFGLLSKPMLVSLPFVLLFLDIWPLNRFYWNVKNVVRLVVEKLPLIALATASSITTIVVQQAAIGGFDRIYSGLRLSNAITTYCTYLGQLFLPINLAVFYPYVVHSQPVKLLACILFLSIITAVVAFGGKRNKFLIAGWLWYVVTLIPVIGIVQVGDQAHADRYTYIPSVGIFIMVSWALMRFVKTVNKKEIITSSVVAVFLLVVMVGMTRQQVGYWKDDFSLFNHAAKATKGNTVAYANLASYYDRTGRTDAAINNYMKVLSVYPGDEEANYNLGVIYTRIRQFNMAIFCYLKALEANPEKIEILNNLAAAYVQNNEPSKAVPLLQKALAIARTNKDEIKIRDLTGNLNALKASKISFEEKK